MKRIALLLMVGLLGFSSAASAQEIGTSYFFGGSGSFTSTKAADAEDDAERTEVFAANPTLLVSITDNIYVGAGAFLFDNGEDSDVAVDVAALYLLGTDGNRPYGQCAITDVAGDRSYGCQAGLLAPFAGVYVDVNVFYRRIQGEDTDGDHRGIALGFRLKR